MRPADEAFRDSPASCDSVESLSAATAEQFLEILSPRNELWSPDPLKWIYRGHGDATWKLQPTAVRDLSIFAKFGIRSMPRAGDGAVPDWGKRKALLDLMLRRFRSGLDHSGLVVPASSPRVTYDEWNQYSSSAAPEREAFPLMALAQHHGLPTMLLDWTRRAWVAAYFAAASAADGEREHGPHLAVWALSLGAVAREILLEIYEPPGSTNPNLNAQAGVFTFSIDEDDLSLEELAIKRPGIASLKRISLHASEAPKLLRLLAYEGITGASMFPGADGVVRAMREERLWDMWGAT